MFKQPPRVAQSVRWHFHGASLFLLPCMFYGISWWGDLCLLLVLAMLTYNFQRWMSRFEWRWRAQRSAISIVNCRIPWTDRNLNAYCAFGKSLKACLLQCVCALSFQLYCQAWPTAVSVCVSSCVVFCPVLEHRLLWSIWLIGSCCDCQFSDDCFVLNCACCHCVLAYWGLNVCLSFRCMKLGWQTRWI